MNKMLLCLVPLSGLLLAACLTAAQQTLTFHIGATVGRDGSCVPFYRGTALGYQYFFDWLAKRAPIAVTDASGKTYLLRLQLRLISHNCTEEGRAAAMSSLINGTEFEPPVHLLLGGNDESALEDALQAEAASRILMHCCTARDTVFHLGLSHVYGLFTSPSMYTGTLLRTMALRGMQRVAVLYNRDSLLQVELCEGALTQLPTLAELRPEFRAVLIANYSALDADSPGFWGKMGARVASAGADVLVACDSMNRTSLLVHQLRRSGYRLSALWLASSGNVSEFLDYLGGHREYALTTVQWMPSLPYADPDFGTAAQYYAAFTAAMGQQPSYFSAAATASGYVLLTALQRVISTCSLEKARANVNIVDTFMWSEGALSCVDKFQNTLDIKGKSGTDVLRNVLSTLNMDTFYGPIGFNGFHQNIYHPVIGAQVLSGSLVAVLPLDVADKALVMPIPVDPPKAKSWITTPTGISVVTLLFCIGAACMALLFLVCRRRMGHHLHAHSVELLLDDIQVDIQPHINSDGSCEPGEGMYRGTRVKLVVANELLLWSRSQRAWKPDNQGSPLTSVFESSECSGQRQLAAPLRSYALPVAAETRSPAQRSKSAALEDTCVDRTSQGSMRLTGSEGFGLFKQQSERFIRNQIDNVTPRTTVGLVSPANCPGMQNIRNQPVTMPGLLSRRARRQILALVWRAVRLQHPRMCPVLGIVWEWPGLVENGGKVPVVVRQWHELDSLERLLENETVPLSLMTKATIAQGVAEALAYLHAQGPPIIAGPLEASRIIMDKNFNPHLFLRLQNLDPEYINAAMASADGSRMGKMRALSVFGARPLQLQQSATVSRAAPTAQPLKAVPSAASDPTTSTAVLHFTVTMPMDDDGSRVHPQLQGIGVGPYQQQQSRITSTSVLSDVEQPAMGTLRPAGLFASQPRYRPSKEQDVYEFGLLLCRIFVVASPEDSGRLRFANIASAAIAPVTATGGDGGGFDCDTSVAGVSAFLSTAAPPVPILQTVDPEQLDMVISEVRGICPELGNLAWACTQPNSGLTFPTIAKALEQVVIPALTGSDGLPRGLRRNALSMKVYGSAGSGGFGGGSAGCGSAPRQEQDLELRSMSSGVGRSGPSQLMPRRSGSVTWPDHLRAVRVNHHHQVVASDDLIFDIFPPKVARALQAGQTVQPERYDCVSIFFSDVVGYTDLCGQLQPGEVMDLVHRLYSRFDDLIRELRLFKVETVGDAYLAVANLRWPQPDDHARLMAQFALFAVRAANSLLVHPERPELGTVHVRVGLHCGPVVGSVVGTLNRRYCLFGDAVNTAARMEHNSMADRINCSAAFAALLREQWPGGARIVSRGILAVKGKGPMETFWVEQEQTTETVLALDDVTAVAPPVASGALIPDAVEDV
ncbi:hypothetical protein VaNZ11_014264 [Volvox africanus]|uniref:Guanylate cyclase domain-containing protein n=1 Tax=Volvox africanus TaxID=51714 RepID=A0ABQ5SIY9_9CHLO|nr:hypothetical protein VaNZ11_014264 [Volvox africanus]